MLVFLDRTLRLATEHELTVTYSGKHHPPQVGNLRYIRDHLDNESTTPTPVLSMPEASMNPSPFPESSLSVMQMRILQGPIIVLIIMSGLLILGALAYKLYFRRKGHFLSHRLRPAPGGAISKASFLDLEQDANLFQFRHTVSSMYSVTTPLSGSRNTRFSVKSWLKRSSIHDTTEASNGKRQTLIIDLTSDKNGTFPRYKYPRVPPPAYVAAEDDRHIGVIQAIAIPPSPQSHSQPTSPLSIRPDVPRSPISPGLPSPVSPSSPKVSPKRSLSFKWKRIPSRKSVKAARSQPVSPPASPKKLPRLVNVVSDFAPVMPDDLAIRSGDTLRLLEEYENSWCLVQHIGPQDGEQGFVPSRCLADRLEVIPILPRQTANIAFVVHRPPAGVATPQQR